MSFTYSEVSLGVRPPARLEILIYLQHLFGVAEDRLKTGTLRISLQTQDKQLIFLQACSLQLCTGRSLGQTSAASAENVSGAEAPPLLPLLELTLMNSTFSRSEPCWSELIRWRESVLPPEQEAQEEQHNANDSPALL